MRNHYRMDMLHYLIFLADCYFPVRIFSGYLPHHDGDAGFLSMKIENVMCSELFELQVFNERSPEFTWTVDTRRCSVNLLWFIKKLEKVLSILSIFCL